MASTSLLIASMLSSSGCDVVADWTDAESVSSSSRSTTGAAAVVGPCTRCRSEDGLGFVLGVVSDLVFLDLGVVSGGLRFLRFARDWCILIADRS